MPAKIDMLKLDPGTLILIRVSRETSLYELHGIESCIEKLQLPHGGVLVLPDTIEITALTEEELRGLGLMRLPQEKITSGSVRSYHFDDPE